MIHKECGLNKVMFNKFFKEEIEDVTLLMSVFKFDMLFFSKSLCFFICLDFIEINTCILLDSINHCNSFKRFTEIHLNTVVNNLCCAENSLCNMTVKIFCKVHHTVVISVCLIEFHKCELGIVSCVKTFVTEYTTDFVNSFHTADDKSLKVKFK